MSALLGCESLALSQINHAGCRKFLKRTGLDLIKVPVRMNGLTSSGTKGRCYFNVSNLVEEFGGQPVFGWSVSESTLIKDNNKRSRYQVNIELHGHAVWLNDRGQLSDPTAKNWVEASQDNPRNYDRFALCKEHNSYFLKFIPVKIGSLYDSYGCESVILHCSFDHRGNKIGDWNIHAILYERGGTEIPLAWKNLNRELINSTLLYRYNWEDRFPSWDRYRQFSRQEGRFKEASIRTGRTLDEIRTLRLKKASTNSHSSPVSANII